MIGRLSIVGLMVAVAPVAAQVRPLSQATLPPQPPTANTAQIQARHEISALEGVLENAVQYGARMLMQSVQTSPMPDMVTLTGMARARGFRLDGYGVVFDVEFPSIRRSVMWSMRTLLRPDRDLLAAMHEFRKDMGPADAAAKQALDEDIKDLEAQIKASDTQRNAQRNVSAASAAPAASGPASVVTASRAPDPAMAQPTTFDPRAVYLGEITSALIDAILDHGGPIGVGPEEWLTVAARESADRGFMPNDPNDTAMTFILRMKGSDLTALRERRLSRDDARQRVELKQY